MKDKFLSIDDLKNGKFHEKLDLSEVLNVSDLIIDEIKKSDLSEEEKKEEMKGLISDLVNLRDELKKTVAKAKERIKIQNN